MNGQLVQIAQLDHHSIGLMQILDQRMHCLSPRFQLHDVEYGRQSFRLRHILLAAHTIAGQTVRAEGQSARHRLQPGPR